MNTAVSSLYQIEPAEIIRRMRAAIAGVVTNAPAGGAMPIFFRADDIGVISGNFLDMLAVFEKHRLPLCLAVVPTWLTAARWQALGDGTDTASPLWCWHQHGWKHANHETEGKKFEFGAARPDHAVKHDLLRGKTRLEEVVGASFSPFFTPPWNRCSQYTLEMLAPLGFHGISRSRGEQRQPAPLPDIFINVDLHTRRESDPAASLDALCGEIDTAAGDGHIGVMLHHQRMNDRALAVLDGFLETITAEPRLLPAGFHDFLATND